MLRSRQSRREEPLGAHGPDLIASRAEGIDPEHEALLAGSVGFALLVVLDPLAPAERVAFVLHDMFDLPFDEIAPIVGRTPVTSPPTLRLGSTSIIVGDGKGLPAGWDPNLVD
jgi:RNA polymerase sigma-70 factor (ECF subfamily)